MEQYTISHISRISIGCRNFLKLCYKSDNTLLLPPPFFPLLLIFLSLLSDDMPPGQTPHTVVLYAHHDLVDL